MHPRTREPNHPPANRSAGKMCNDTKCHADRQSRISQTSARIAKRRQLQGASLEGLQPQTRTFQSLSLTLFHHGPSTQNVPPLYQKTLPPHPLLASHGPATSGCPHVPKPQNVVGKHRVSMIQTFHALVPSSSSYDVAAVRSRRETGGLMKHRTNG